MCILALPAIFAIKDIEYRLEAVLELPTQRLQIIETNRPFANVGPIEFAIQCHLDSVTIIGQCVTPHARLELFHRLRLCPVILGHDRGTTELGFDRHSAEGFHEHSGGHRRNQRAQVLGAFGAMNRWLVDDVGNYEILGWIALATQNKPHGRKAPRHFDDLAAALAIVNTPEKADGGWGK